MTDNFYEEISGDIISATEEIFATMISMEIKPKDKFYQKEDTISTDILSLVSFTGKQSGIIAIFCSTEIALKITTNMLGMEVKELDQDTKDAIGEVTNMVAGNVKNRICNKFGSMDLSVPIVIAGAALTISSSAGSQYDLKLNPSVTCDSQNSWLMTPFTVNGHSFNVGMIVKKSD